MNEQQENDAARKMEQGTAMKRRGILRAAGMALGAVAAGIAAKQTSQPVRAVTTDTSFIAEGGGNIGYTTVGSYTYGVLVIGNTVGVQGDLAGASGYGVIGGRKGVSGNTFNGGGVQGLSDNGYALEGKAGAGRAINAVSDSGYGIYVTAGGTQPAIHAENDTNADGIQGYAGGPHAGVAGWGGFNGGGVGVIGFGAYSNNSADADGVQGHGTGKNAGVAGYGGPNNGPGIYGSGGGSSGTGVYGTSTGGCGVYGTTAVAGSPYAAVFGENTANSGTGVRGQALAGGGFGVTGSGNTGVSGDGTGIGVQGVSTNGWGGNFSGGLAPLHLVPATSGAGAPSSGSHSTGELYVDHAGALFYCTIGGTPGTWVNLSTPASGGGGGGGVTGIAAPGGTATGAVTLAAGANVTLAEANNTITISAAGGSGGGSAANLPVFVALPTPERFVDTRANLGGLQGPVPAGTTHAFQMTGRNGQSGNSALRIPDTATALVGNLTVVGAAGIPLGSYLTLWPGGAQPTVSNINYGPGGVTGAVANGYVVGLGTSGGHGSVSVYNLSACDYILDVTGYYESAGSAGLASAASKP